MLTYYRPPMYGELNVRKIEEACRERRFAVDVGVWASIDYGEFIEDPIKVGVKRAVPPVPVVSQSPTDVDVSLYANAVRNVLRNAVTYYGERDGIRLMGEAPEGRAQAEMVSHRVVNRSRDKDFDRLVTEVVCNVHPDTMLDSAPVTLMREAVDREVGNMAENVGRVIAVDHFDVKVLAC
jgi:hypothetical protein